MTGSPWWRGVAVAACSGLLVVLAGCGSTGDNLAGRTPEKLYAEAREEMDAGSWERAIKALERVEGLAAGTLIAQQAQLDLAYAYWKSNEKAQALTAIDRFIKLNPSSAALDYALYLRGLIHFNDDLGLLGRWAGQDLSERDQAASRDAFAAFKQLVEQYPQSKYAADARQRMTYIVGSLAANEVHVARYYLRRGAYLAAANRAQAAITEFPDSASSEEALAILVASYDKLDLPQLRDDARRVLVKNFPDSRFLTEGPGAGQRPWWRLF